MTATPADAPDRERGPDEAFCRNCGAIISDAAEICPECGVRQRPPPTSSVDSAVQDLLDGGNPFVAAVLSALLPGLGQIYNREIERGIAFIVASFVALLSTLLLVGFVLYPLVWLYAIYDAYTRAERRNESDEATGEPANETADDASEATDERD
ncbi:MAG: DUF5683 domain-containing protein [Haloarculaceae archaeon]